MDTQTERAVRKPNSQRGKGGKNAKRYYKQTARVEARRDGKPLVFGWGKHLSHSEKVRMQRRATWGLAALVLLVLAGVIVSSWIDINIVIPGEAITTVNGHAIPQSEYREMVAVKTQLELNKLYGPNGMTAQATSLEQQYAQTNNSVTQTQNQITNLKNQIKKLPSGSSTQRTNLTNQLDAAEKTLTTEQTKSANLQNEATNLNQNTIPVEKQGFTQSQIGNDSGTWLQDDELLREWLTTQSPAIQAKINPSPSQVNRDFNSLIANMPKSNGYNTYMSQMGITNDQIMAMLTILDRRNNAQTYFSSLLTSPAYQVLARQIVVPTQQKADQVLADIQKGQSFGTLAKQFSQDTNTNQKGGNLGWMMHYQYIDTAGLSGPSVVDNWLFDPARRLNELSPVLYGNGSYYIEQIMNIDPAQDVSSSLLKSLQSNALVDWLQDLRAFPGQSVTELDQNMLFDSNNLPPNNILPSSAPASATPAS